MSNSNSEQNRDKIFRKIANKILKYYQKSLGYNIADNNFLIELSQAIKTRFGKPILPNKGETIAVTNGTPKTVALFFDRVWSPFLAEISPEIAVYGATDFEIWSTAICVLLMPFDSGEGSKKERIDQIYEHIKKVSKNTPLELFFHHGFPVSRIVAEYLFQDYGLIATPVYNSFESLNEEYLPGKIEILLAAIKDIGIVDENKLEWSQVMEFRKDADARRKYRRMIHWLDSELIGKSAKFIADEIDNKIYNYEMALKKHGIETTDGCYSRIIDPRFFAGPAALGAGVGALSGDLLVGAIAGLVLSAGKAAISITKAALDIKDRQRGKDSEIAYVYELKKKLK